MTNENKLIGSSPPTNTNPMCEVLTREELESTERDRHLTDKYLTHK